MNARTKEKMVTDLYERKHRAVFFHCLGYTRNEHEAEELVQDVYFNVFNKLDWFRGECKIDTWLFRITKNVCLNFIRRKKHLKEISTCFQLKILWKK